MHVAGWEDERPRAKEYGWPGEARKSREMNSPWELPERSTALLTLWFSHNDVYVALSWPIQSKDNKLAFGHQVCGKLLQQQIVQTDTICHCTNEV